MYTTQSQLPDSLRAVLEDALRPNLVAVLRDNLAPLNASFIANEELVTRHHTTLSASVLHNHTEISSSIHDIRSQMQDSQVLQRQIWSALNGPKSSKDESPGVQPCKRPFIQEGGEGSPKDVKESLQELYYLVFLFLGHFFKNLFLALSRLLQPSKALMPNLIAKYNISFLDAIGRQPRILPYEYFRSFRVLQAFVQEEFRSLPGALWVERGRYQFFNALANRALSPETWNTEITPGAIVLMSMVARKGIVSSSGKVSCPATSCSGRWPSTHKSEWTTW